MSGKVAVGEAVRPQGLRGAVRVRPWLDGFEAYARITEVSLRAEPGRRLEVESLSRGGKGSIVWKFRGVDTLEAAEALRGAVFLAEREALRGEEEGVLYWEDFEGRDIVDESGRVLGRVEDMFGAGGNDVLVVRTPGGDELLLPATREVVLGREGERWLVRPPRLADAGGGGRGERDEDGGEGRDAL